MNVENFLVFDIETVPDVELGRRLYELSAELSDEDVVRAMEHVQEQKTGSRFLPLVQHRVIAIAGLCPQGDHLHIAPFCRAESPEKELLETFYHYIDTHQPTLISWNGGAFDLPILHYRSLRHRVSSELYWETGNRYRDYRYNNYQSRYHSRHLDLMDKLASHQSRASAALNQVTKLLGMPCKTEMDGSQVCEAWLAGELESIRHYCELDVINTYVVFLYFALISRNIRESVFEDRIRQLRETLSASPQAHLQQFVETWTPQ